MASGKSTGSGKNTVKKTGNGKNRTSSKAPSTSRRTAPKNSGSKSAPKTVALQRPIRREAWALVCLLLSIFTMLGCLGNDGVIIKGMKRTFGGLIGFGYYIVPAALLLAAVILFWHHGRPIRLRTFGALIIPLLVACIYHLFANLPEFMVSEKLVLEEGWFKGLWDAGTECTNGGALGGTICFVFTYMFSKPGAALLFFAVSLFFLWIALGPFITTFISIMKARERIEYEMEDEEDPVEKYEAHLREQLAKKKAAYEPVPFSDTTSQAGLQMNRAPVHARPVKPSDYDIPLDDVAQGSGASQRKGSFFNSKPQVASPDEVIAPDSVKNNDRKAEANKANITPADAGIEIVADPYDVLFEKAKVPPTPITAEEIQILPETDNKNKSVRVKESDPFIPPEDVAASGVISYKFPPIELLATGEPNTKMDGSGEVSNTRERLDITLSSFGINSKIKNTIHGPSVTRYELELETGVRLNRLTSLSDDIALALGVSGVRIAAIPNKLSTVGIEVPNKLVNTVYLRDIIDSNEFTKSSSRLTFAIGKNIAGEAVVGNIAKLPHMLVAGTTGSGKSVFLNSLILSILYKATPDEVKFIMVDPKMVEFKVYMGIPHLLVPVVTEAKKAAGALQWAVAEMMKRYAMFSESGAREIGTYNKIAAASLDLNVIPQIVIIIDELADLMLVAAKEVEESICRIAQMGRAAGIHLVIATQSPRADIITGLMKANIPSRVSFKVASALESRIILDAGGGAENLMGNGDMLFAPIGSPKPARIQGAWVTDDERESIVDYIKSSGEANYSDDVMHQIDINAAGKGSETAKTAASADNKFADYDELLPKAVDVIFEANQASVSVLQRRMKLGYARAGRIMDQLEELHIVGPHEGSKPRQILITKNDWNEMRYVNGTAPVTEPEKTQTEQISADDEL